MKWVLTHQADPIRITRVSITPIPDSEDGNDFEEFPQHPGLRAFDRSDRKFVATANACPGKPPILQASDSKWQGWKTALGEAGITVKFLCPDEIETLYRSKM